MSSTHVSDRHKEGEELVVLAAKYPLMCHSSGSSANLTFEIIFTTRVKSTDLGLMHTVILIRYWLKSAAEQVCLLKEYEC